MSLIIHRCTKCNKPDTWHDDRKLCPGGAWTGPELIPTFDQAGHRMTTVIAPGGPAGPPGVKTCACDDCITLHRTGGER